MRVGSGVTCFGRAVSHEPTRGILHPSLPLTQHKPPTLLPSIRAVTDMSVSLRSMRMDRRMHSDCIMRWGMYGSGHMITGQIAGNNDCNAALPPPPPLTVIRSIPPDRKQEQNA